MLGEGRGRPRSHLGTFLASTILWVLCPYISFDSRVSVSVSWMKSQCDVTTEPFHSLLHFHFLFFFLITFCHKIIFWAKYFKLAMYWVLLSSMSSKCFGSNEVNLSTLSFDSNLWATGLKFSWLFLHTYLLIFIIDFT